MEFKLRYKREFVAALVGIIIAFYILDLYGYKGYAPSKLIVGFVVLAILLVRYILVRDDGYIIKSGKIIIRNSDNKYFQISKIKCIKQVWTSLSHSPRRNKLQYFIILKNSNNRLEIDLRFRNIKGQSLLTVLESKYDVQVNRVV